MLKKTQLSVLFILLAIVSVQGSRSTKSELQILRENYIRLAMEPENTSKPLMRLLLDIPQDEGASDQMVVELQECYPINPEEVQKLLLGLDKNGQWADINYADTRRSNWEPRTHVRRLLTLAKAFRSERLKYYNSPEVEDAIHRGLDYWFNADLVCRNWWYNEIGIPKTLGGVFLLFEDQLTATEKKAAIAEMNKAQIKMTGQNKVWLAGNVLVRAILENNFLLVKEARDVIVSEIVTGNDEGIQSDWSFHQHGAQQQFGNYGLAFIRSMGFYSGLFAKTSLAIDNNRIDLLSNLLGNGYRWILWKGYMDINSLDRQLFRNAQVDKAFSVALAAQELAASENKKSNDVASVILSDNFYPEPIQNGLVGYKHFDRSDMTIHRTKDWMASLKMASTRVIGTEQVNEDNLKGFYMADGALYTYINGDEYLDIFPLWDWRKIPGITSFESNAPIPTYKHTEPKSRNQSSFVGGISVDNVGISVMELNRDGLHAQKAWIFTDNFICAFGSGIRTDSTLKVTTSIDQRLKRDHDILVYDDMKGWLPASNKAIYAKQEHRFLHDETGYIVTKGDPCIIHDESHTGQWHDFMGTYTPQDISGDVVSLYLDHGISPQNASYCYFILPHTDKQQIGLFNTSAVKIIRNDSRVQIATLPDNSIYFLAIKEPVKMKLEDSLSIDLKETGIYIYKRNGTTWDIKFQPI